MAAIRILLILIICCSSCLSPAAQKDPNSPQASNSASSTAIATSFAYPIGAKETVTQAKDRDGWYNALDFGANDHLGEDWNKDTGGNSDCGEPVYAAGNGLITYAQDAGPGWGNVVIIEHTMPSGEKIQSLFGHMLEMLRTEGEVKMREQIGKIGNANGRYLCHLHFEIRTSDCPMWSQAGGGYARDRKGWLDPSDFIDNQRQKHDR